MQLTDPTLVRSQAFIGGQWTSAPHGATYAVRNPATGETLCHVARADAELTQRAVAAAHTALPGYRALDAKTRADLLKRLVLLVSQHREDLARLITYENGKPLSEARAEIDYATSFLEWFGEEARRVYGNLIPPHRSDARLLVYRQPVGVCAGITPWNFPAAMVTRKLGPALASGCTLVLKPAEATPLTALALAELTTRAGIPAGVFNVVTGDRPDAAAIGDVLTSSPLVRKVSFTGSTRVGKLLAARCASTVKRVSLELGGNAPFILFDDADVDAAVEGVMMAKFRNAGQACVAANRIFVQDGVYDRFISALRTRIERLSVGPGLEDGVQIGPLINEAGLSKCEAHVRDALAHGAKLTVGGRPHALGGTFFEPGLLENVTPQMALSQEETFGPVAAVMRFAGEREVIAMANDTESGLAAYFYTRDNARVWRVSEALEYGMVGVNTGLISTAVAPFGGVKESGLGREGSVYGIDDWVEL